MSIFNADMLMQLLTIVGILAFVVSAITEVIKNLSFFKKIPTDIIVIILSITLTIIAFLGYCDYSAIALTWYIIVGAIVCGFFVAFITMYGWSKVSELYRRYKNPKE